MVEIVALWFLGRRVGVMADVRRRDRGWAALLVMGWALGELLGWTLGRRLGLGTAVSYLLALFVGAGAGAAVIAWLRALPPVPSFDPRVYDRTWSEGSCPRCGSEQTYVTPARVRCFRCDYAGKATLGRPSLGERAPG